MKQGTFNIINGIPIVFAYGLPKKRREKIWKRIISMSHKECGEIIKEYESSRQEWDVESVEIIPENEFGIIKKEQQVQFKEITPPTKDKRGKCKIIKIES